MILELIKLISALLYPIGISVGLALLAIFGRLIGWTKLSRISSTMALVVVLFFSIPIVAGRLADNLESQFPVMSIENIERHDAIVVLGGGLRIPTPPTNRAQLGAASDRYLYASELYKADKGKVVIVTGGNFREQEGLQGEAYYAGILLQQWGVKTPDILIDQESKTTEQNSNYVKGFLEQNKLGSIILVTSAIHTPRAMALFKNTGLKVTPGPADHRVRTGNSALWQSYIPSAHALLLSTAAIHEYYGILFLTLKNWLHTMSMSDL